MNALTNKKYKVSVLVIPTHTRNTLNHTLNSLFKQTYQDIEIILLDKGESTQLTQDMLQASQHYSNIIYVEVKDKQSPVASYNEGIEKASGDYIVIAKLDDVMDEKRIERQVAYLEASSDTVMVCADMEGISALEGKAYASYYQHHRLKVYEEDQTTHLIQSNFVLGNTLCFNKNLQDVMFPIPTTLDYEDWWLAFTASLYGKIHYMDEVLVTHYISEEENGDFITRKKFINYRVGIAASNAKYYAEMVEYCRKHKQHYLAVIQPIGLRDQLISEYRLSKRMEYYFSEAVCKCRRKIRIKERLKIWAYLWCGPYLLIIKH